jgi:hypothetical protein
MVINKIYPHVNVTTTALVRTPTAAVNNGATTLFVPFVANKGLSNQVQKIFNLSQFTAEYGIPDYEKQGRTILNVYNWLTAGGAVYALRLVGSGATKANNVTQTNLIIEAKHEGSYYNSIELRLINVSTTSTKYIKAEVLVNSVRVQTFSRLSADNFIPVLESSEYFGSVAFKTGIDFDKLVTALGAVNSTGLTLNFNGGADSSESLEKLVRNFFELYSGTMTTATAVNLASLPTTDIVLTLTAGGNAPSSLLEVGDVIRMYNGDDYLQGTIGLVDETTITLDVEAGYTKLGSSSALQWEVLEVSSIAVSGSSVIGNKLEHPIDMILDAGYPSLTKQAIANFTNEADGSRSDIVVLFDEFDFSGTAVTGAAAQVESTSINHAVYSQRLIVNDVVAGKDINVTPTYFLASLIPNNDFIFGRQFPTAGLTRGVLSGVKGINENPTEEKKNENYQNGINYIEKDSRGHYFMSQLTRENEDTALRYLNNVRVLTKMVRDLEDLGREYLFEFNDTTTLNNMRNALNRYVIEWIQNRTLSLGTVQVTPDELRDDKVNVTLNIRFTGTIEIISVDITIE